MALAEARPVSLALADGAARHSFARIPEVAPIPNLIKVQRDSFEWFLREGLKELFAEISPIQDFTSRNMDLELAVPGPDGEPGYSFGLPKMSEDECREHDTTYAAPLKVRMRLKIKSGENAGEIKEQDIFMGDFPLMTDNGTFIINGAERVVVSQLVRSPGVYFTVEEDPTSGRDLCMGKLIPSRGAWLDSFSGGIVGPPGSGRPGRNERFCEARAAVRTIRPPRRGRAWCPTSPRSRAAPTKRS